MRTCVACREVKSKRELVRLVRNLSGSVQVDTGGREPGRGAYLCRVLECWQNGLAGGRLEYVLKTSLARENREQLIEYGKALFGGC
jgi:predicted RNA-binding protein YlxR (DUF448 family)